MKSQLKFISISLLIFSLLSFVTSAHAQTPNSLDGVDISTNPNIPAPGSNVTVKIESYSTDLNSASIVWSINNKPYAKGVGITTIDIIAPPLGKSTDIFVTIMSVEGKEIKKALTLSSGGVDLVWESAGYTPPFYRGKTLFAYQNPIKVTAIPHLAGQNGLELDPRTLVYKWKMNDKVIQDQSGYGKQTLITQEDIPQPLDISVEVGTKTGTEKAASEITLTPTDPSISFYEEDPLYGVLYNQSLPQRTVLTNQEITLRAVPFSFNPAGISYTWSINDLERGDLSTNRSITLRTKGGVTGSSDISLEIRNAVSILEGARNAVSLYFNSTQTTQ